MPPLRHILILLLLCSPLHAQGKVIDGKQKIADIPSQSADEIARSPFGKASVEDAPAGDTIAVADRVLPNVRDNVYQNWRGTGIAPTKQEGRILDCMESRCYVGAKLPKVDFEISRCRLFNNRDVNLWVAMGAGNCYSHGNHCYGAQLSVYNEGAWQFREDLDTIADALVGSLYNAQTTCTNCMWQHNKVCDCCVKGGYCQFIGCNFNVQLQIKEQNEFRIAGLPYIPGKSGIEVDGDYCSINSSTIDVCNWINRNDAGEPLEHPTGIPATAVVVNAHNCTINATLIDSDGLDGTKGIVINNPIHALFVRCPVKGFGGKSEKALSFTANGSCAGLDAIIWVDGATKPLEDYVDLSGEWTGSVLIVDRVSGSIRAIVKGKPVPVGGGK